MVVTENELVGEGGGNHVDEIPSPGRAWFLAIVRKPRKGPPTEKLVFLRLSLRIIHPAEEEVGFLIDVPVVTHHLLVLVEMIGVLELHDFLPGVARVDVSIRIERRKVVDKPLVLFTERG